MTAHDRSIDRPLIATVQDVERVEAKLDRLMAMLEGATVTPRAEWVSIPEAAKRANCHPDTIKRRIEDGALKARGSGKLRRVYLP